MSTLCSDHEKNKKSKIENKNSNSRTREERGIDPLVHNKFVIPKSRYDSIDSYLSGCCKNWNGYNDKEVTFFISNIESND